MYDFSLHIHVRFETDNWCIRESTGEGFRVVSDTNYVQVC